jgi:serine/threonine protein kinase
MCGMFQTNITHNSTGIYPSDPSSPLSTGALPQNHLLNQRYRLLKTIGQGGMGAVYLAQDTQLGDRLVALKEMSTFRLYPQDLPLVIMQFRQEAHLLASLHHPHLPAIHEYFTENGRWYLIMSFIEGQNLQIILNATPDQKIPANEVVRIGIELCDVLEYLHTHEPPIIFRDLKPQNIMITPKGHICLIDFGIARHFKQEQTNDTAHFYSVGYAPPEQYGQSQTSPRSDIYSLGATLHQMLSGLNPAQQPFKFAPLQLLDAQIPALLARLIEQMVEMDQQKRPSHVVVVKQQLERIHNELVGNARSAYVPDTWQAGSQLLLREQSPEHTYPTIRTSRPIRFVQKDRAKARPLTRRSLLVGLLGGAILATAGGVFILNHPLTKTATIGSNMHQIPKPVLKPTLAPTATATTGSMNWTNFQRIAGQSSKATPALAASPNGTLHLVFMTNDARNDLLYLSSPNHSINWNNYQAIPGQASHAAPALAAAPDGTLHLVFVANNVDNGLLYLSSMDNGITWGNYQPIPGQASKTTPALAASPNGTLHVVFVANNVYNSLLYISSADNGKTWGNYQGLPGQASKTAPALTVSSNGTLHLVFTANNEGSGLLYTSSTDNGNTWNNVYYTGQSSLLAPALAIVNNTLYMAFVVNDGSNQLCIVSSQDGINWTPQQGTGQTTSLAPTLAVLNNTLYMAFIANDSSDQLCIVSSHNP